MELQSVLFWKLYGVAFLVLCVIDLIWLGWIARDFYREQLGLLMKRDVNWWAAGVFYLLFILGLVYFVVFPAHAQALQFALINGAFFGLVAYATYDLTNLATLENFPWKIAIVDLVWGSFLCMSVSGITHWVGRQWF